jgi:hypothetical protein
MEVIADRAILFLLQRTVTTVRETNWFVDVRKERK